MRALVKITIMVAAAGILAVSLSGGAPVSAAQARSLQEALAMARASNPTLRAQRMRLKATAQQLDQAYSGYKPNIVATAGIVSAQSSASNFGGADGSTSKDIDISAVQPLYRGGRTRAAVRAARRVIAAANADLDAQEQSILLQTVNAYVDVLRNQHMIALRMESRAAIARELEAAQIRFDVGDNTKTDVALARARLARASADLTAARGDLKKSSAAYEALIGEAPDILRAPNINIKAPTTLKLAQEKAAAQHPQLVAAYETYALRQENIDEVFGELLPQIELSGLWGKSFDPQPGILDEQSNKSIGVQVSIPLYMGGATRARMRAAKYTAAASKIEIEEMRRAVVQNLAVNWASWHAVRGEIIAREAEVAAAALALEGMTLERDLGTRSTLDVLSADQDYINARAALLTAQRGEVSARFETMAAMGILTGAALNLEGDIEDGNLMSNDGKTTTKKP